MEIETFEVSLQVNLLSSEGAERVEALVRPTDAPAWCIALGRRKRKRGTSGTLWCREIVVREFCLDTEDIDTAEPQRGCQLIRRAEFGVRCNKSQKAVKHTLKNNCGNFVGCHVGATRFCYGWRCRGNVGIWALHARCRSHRGSSPFQDGRTSAQKSPTAYIEGRM